MQGHLFVGATDTYLGEHEIPAAYVQADLAWGNWRLIGGVRVEDSEQQVITFDRNNPDNPPIVSEIADTDVLPALSLVYKIGADTNLRFSASQTVNRPEYRELAPFDFSVRRAAMPLQDVDPFGEAFFEMFGAWREAGSPYHGVPRS